MMRYRSGAIVRIHTPPFIQNVTDGGKTAFFGQFDMPYDK